MKKNFNEKTTIRDLCQDKDVGKYMLYLYYPKRYLNEVMDQTIAQTAKYGLDSFNFFKEKIIEGNVKQYFINENKPDIPYESQ